MKTNPSIAGNAGPQVDKELARTSKLLRRKRIWKQNIPLYVMFLPIIAFYLIFRYTPMLGLVIAFKDYHFADGIFGSPWVGFKHFEMMFSNPQMLTILKNTLLLSSLSIFVGFPFPIILAILLNEVRKLFFKKAVQTLVYLPHFLNWVIVGGIVITLFSQQSGIVNTVMESLTGRTFPFLYDNSSWIAIYVGSGIWKEAGWGSIIYLAALTTINPSLYEASAIDGAGKFKQIWNVTLPGLAPTIVMMLILKLGHVMEVGFDHVYVLQNSAVSEVSEVISTWNYNFGLNRGKFSLATAMGLFEALIGLILVLAANRIAKIFKQELW